MYEKLKSFLADDAFFTVMLMILVGVISFGLGRQSSAENVRNATENQPAGVVFTESVPAEPVLPTVKPQKPISSAQVVASRSGTKYHLPTCPGAAQIKEANKIYFDSTELAEAAGYTPAANCPGLQ
jgi:hypothetical protein